MAIKINKLPKLKTFLMDIGESKAKGASVLVGLPSKTLSLIIKRKATNDMAANGISVALNDAGAKIVAIIRFRANMAIVVRRHKDVIFDDRLDDCALELTSATVALLFTNPPKIAPR